uniref:Putative ovule protein n=1 Tax=Solanum chacoense TaxID=4108 RepID=A0A0V0IWM8_SOLCH
MGFGPFPSFNLCKHVRFTLCPLSFSNTVDFSLDFNFEATNSKKIWICAQQDDAKIESDDRLGQISYIEK